MTHEPEPKLLDAPVYSAVVSIAADPAAVGLEGTAATEFPGPTPMVVTRVPTRMPTPAPTPTPTPIPARPVPTLTPVHTLTGHTAGVWDVQYAPDGRTLLLTASDDNTARVWNTVDGQEIAVLEGHTDKVWHANFAPDANHIATAGLDGTARLWQLVLFRGAPAGEAIQTGELAHDGPVYDARFSPDGMRVVTAGGDNVARIWDVTSDKVIDLKGHTAAVITAQFSPDGAAGGHGQRRQDGAPLGCRKR